MAFEGYREHGVAGVRVTTTRAGRVLSMFLLATSGIYWLPGLAPGLLSGVKDAAVLLLVMLVLAGGAWTKRGLPAVVGIPSLALLAPVAIGGLSGGLSSVYLGARLLLGPLLLLAIMRSFERTGYGWRYFYSLVLPSVLSGLYVTAVVLGLLDPFQPPQPFQYVRPEMIGFSSGMNALANSAAPLAPLLIWMVWRSSGFRRLAHVAVGTVITVAVVVSTGRAGAVAFLGTGALYVLYLMFRRLGLRRVGVVGVWIGLGVGVLVGVYLLVWGGSILAGREAIFPATIRAVLRTPLLGHGWDSGVLGTLKAHNLFLGAAFSAGVVGLAGMAVAFGCLAFSIARRLRAKEDSLGFAAALGAFGALAISFVETTWPFGPFYVSAAWWGVVAITVSAPRLRVGSGRVARNIGGKERLKQRPDRIRYDRRWRGEPNE